MGNTPMTLKEVQNIRTVYDGSVWLEIRNTGLMPALMELAMHNITFFVAIPLRGYRDTFSNDDYNNEWRCWRTRPTIEEMQDSPWEIKLVKNESKWEEIENVSG